ncbi:TRAP transporter permease [Oleomonas cavernae]|uniref:TRAP transporter permease n=1 Tax=Oleomonas cavernae TaxID=2320859 RepID=A0A418WE85_9PROT|nr:TRAP transporter permease [Oleomonas cavernae]
MAAAAIGVAFSLFQIWTAALSPISSLALRSIHVGFLLLLVFLLFGWTPQAGGERKVPWYDWGFGILGFALGFYHLVFEHDLIIRSGDPIPADIVAGCLTLVLIFEASRRIMGLALPIMCGVFIPYALLGPHLPFGLAHRGFTFEQVVDQLYLGTEGIYGTPTFVSATYIFLFVLFGAFLEHAGMIKLFNDVSMGLVGRAKGGPAKVAVISSGLMGTINGSGVANVLTVGQFTIPLMTRFGYRPAFAGAVEATASMGGQIMPPVMGAVAFIMAETLGVAYAEIATAAIIPAILYYASAFWMVHLEAGKQNLRGLSGAEIPSVLAALRKGWYLLLPLAALVTLLFSGYTPLFAGVIGLFATVALILGQSVAKGALGNMIQRVAFWISLGLLAGWAVEQGVAAEAVGGIAILVLGLAAFALRDGRATLALILSSLADGARNALGVGVACALVGVLIGVTTLTGIASSLAGSIVALSGGNLFFALVLTMIACLVLGTGLPTIPNYIITSSIAAPALLQMGVPPIASHMFCFYFGIMADLTPPVALAALAASSIAKAGHMEIGWIATRIALAGYVVPFMAVYDTALLLQTTDPVAIAYASVRALVAIGLWGGVAIGYFFTRVPVWQMPIAIGGALGLILSSPLTDEIGFALAAVFIVLQVMAARRAAPPMARA